MTRTRQTVHIPNLPVWLEQIGDAVVMAGVAEAGVRSVLVVPMLREGHLIGAIALYRHEIRPFAEKQIELIESFAAQAVIAIENARLLEKKSLEQQTATSEVLRVISARRAHWSPCSSDARKATRICEADCGLVRVHSGGAYRTVGICNILRRSLNLCKESLRRQRAFGNDDRDRSRRRSSGGRSLREGRPLIAGKSRRHPVYIRVPLLKDREPVGYFVFTASTPNPSPTSRSNW